MRLVVLFHREVLHEGVYEVSQEEVYGTHPPELIAFGAIGQNLQV